MSAPVLTIAIPTFNRAVWLEQALEIINEQVDANSTQIEVLIANNASTDNTEQIMARYQSNKIFTLYRQPENIGSVRNILFLTEKAKGKFVWMLGDDDFIYKGFLQKLISIINDNLDVAFLFVEMQVWFPAKVVETREDMQLAEFNKVDYSDKELIYTRYDKIKSIADPARGYFNAIGNIILLKEDYLEAFKVGVSGPEFTSIQTTFPHSYHIALHLMDKPCIYIASLGTYCSHAVSWRRYYEITYLRWYPELFMLMAKHGADEQKADEGRKQLFPRYTDMIPRVLVHRAGNYQYFSLLNFAKNNVKFIEFWLLPFWISKKVVKYALNKLT